MFKFETNTTKQPVAEPPKSIALPHIKSYMERRVMTRMPGNAEQWIGKLETEASGDYMMSQLQAETLPVNVIITPRLHNLSEHEKLVSTLSIMIHMDMGDIATDLYG